MRSLLRRLPSPALTGVAVLVFALSCALIRGGLLRSERFGDVSLYAADAHRVLDGAVPYRDFFFEYPPGALAAIVAPALVSEAHYTVLFKVLMAVCGAGVLLLAARIVAEAGFPRVRAAAVLGALALAPVALGPLVLDEFDLWPTLVTVAALLAVLRGRSALGGGLLGFGAATKVFPAAILPALLVWLYRRAGTRAARRALVAFVVLAAATYAGFALAGPGGVWYSIHVQLRRGLQKESLGSAVLLGLDQLGLYRAHIAVGNPHWTELTGPAGDALATLGSLLQVAAAVAAGWLVARRRPDAQALLTATATAVAGFVAFGKVFSPQYLIWLVPLVLLAGGLAEGALLAVALVLTQLWFLRLVTPFDLGAEVWIFILRDGLVLALFGLLFLRLWGGDRGARWRGARTLRRA